MMATCSTRFTFLLKDFDILSAFCSLSILLCGLLKLRNPLTNFLLLYDIIIIVCNNFSNIFEREKNKKHNFCSNRTNRRDYGRTKRMKIGMRRRMWKKIRWKRRKMKEEDIKEEKGSKKIGGRRKVRSEKERKRRKETEAEE